LPFTFRVCVEIFVKLPLAKFAVTPFTSCALIKLKPFKFRLVPAICDPKSSAEEGTACQEARPFASVVSTKPVVAPLGIIIFPFTCRVELLVN
jgi:hypothetical protein